MSRPESQGPADLFYNHDEARKYTQNSRIIEIQSQMSQRAIELLELPEGKPALILDIGCGSGLSGEELTDSGHFWIGLDISDSMLGIALEREVEGDLLLQDMGEGLHFRPGSLDGVISISALQWLCNADKRNHFPRQRLKRFFSTLYSAMCRGAKAVFQIYPETPQQLDLLTSCATNAGFSGGLVIDYPESTKAKKIFLCLFVGSSQPLPKGLDEESSHQTVNYAASRNKRSGKQSLRKAVKSKDWILEKKERRRRQGKEVRENTKYTGRSRHVKF